MSKKILIGLMTLVLTIGLIGAGAFAVFNDTETSTGNTFTAGTLDLTPSSDFVTGSFNGFAANYKVTGGGNGLNGKVEFGIAEGLKPGDRGMIVWHLKNSGTLDGILRVDATLTEAGNGSNEPECIDEGGTWTGTSSTDEANLGGDANMMNCSLMRRSALIYGGRLAGAVLTLDAEVQALGAGEEIKYGLLWNIPVGANNKIQSDSAVIDITFTLDQK